MAKTKEGSEHIVRVDVLRAIAFLLVFCFHFLTFFPSGGLWWKANNVYDFSTFGPLQYFLIPFFFGWLGVALFFVISGFCIHYSFLKLTGEFSVKSFLERRFLRIYPAYFVNIVGCLLLVPWLPTKYLNPWQVAAHLVLVHNLVHETFTGINWVLWSLGVEWQFYLLFPLLLWARKRIGLTRCLIVSLVFSLICQIYFSVRFALPGLPISSDWSFPLVTWCDWILGACLAEAFVEKRPLFPHNTLILVVSFLFLAVALNYRPLCMQSFLISSVFFAAVMDRYLVIKAPLNWFERLLVPVGIVSYSLYLWHQVVIRAGTVIGAALGVPKTLFFEFLLYLPLIALGVAAVSVASYHWVEIGVPRWYWQWKRGAKQKAAQGGAA